MRIASLMAHATAAQPAQPIQVSPIEATAWMGIDRPIIVLIGLAIAGICILVGLFLGALIHQSAMKRDAAGQDNDWPDQQHDPLPLAPLELEAFRATFSRNQKED
jgi:hypothetical protein